MRLRRLMGVADQIVAFWFSSIDLSNKALHIMSEVDDKPWMGTKSDHRRMNELLDTWWTTHAHTLKSGKQARDLIAKTIEELGNPIACNLTERDYLDYRATRVPYRGKDKSIGVSPTTHNLELVYLKGDQFKIMCCW